MIWKLKTHLDLMQPNIAALVATNQAKQASCLIGNSKASGRSCHVNDKVYARLFGAVLHELLGLLLQ